VEGRQALLRWAATWPQWTWAVEGANGLGHPLAQHLVARGEQVLDVPAKLTARVRLLSQGHNRKTDADDSHAIAVAALDSDRLNPVTVDSAAMMLRLLTDRRDELVHQRTRTLNQIHRLLSELIPGGCAGKLTGTRARRILSRMRTRTEVARARRRIVADLVEDAIRLERRIKAMDRDIEQAMGTSSTLPAIYGCGYVTAARILGHVKDITRFPSRAHFASYTGTAPDRDLQRRGGAASALPRR
jgi:transposase